MKGVAHFTFNSLILERLIMIEKSEKKTLISYLKECDEVIQSGKYVEEKIQSRLSHMREFVDSIHSYDGEVGNADQVRNDFLERLL